MSKPHGEPEFTYHPHKVDDAEHFRREYDRIFRKTPRTFLAGDHVHHAPSGEEWTLACDEKLGRVMSAGWPMCVARPSDIKLLKATTPEKRIKMLQAFAERGRGAEAEKDWRTNVAREQLKKKTP